MNKTKPGLSADMSLAMIKKTKEMLDGGEVRQVLAWKEGVLPHLPEPTFFVNSEEANDLTYSKYCGANLSKFLIGSKTKILVFLRFCDTYSFNLLLKENRVKREDAYIIGVGCQGIHDEKDELIVTCKTCVKTKHVVFDELLCPNLHPSQTSDIHTNEITSGVIHTFDEKSKASRFTWVSKIESLTQDDKYAFWQNELKRCIRCNACRNICPSCHCTKCVFDSDKYDSKQNVNASSFEEQMFHIIRAYHVAGRCTDCGQCSRVCPQKIPLYILNRKFIKDINEYFGEFEAGEDIAVQNPLVRFDAQNDPEV